MHKLSTFIFITIALLFSCAKTKSETNQSISPYLMQGNQKTIEKRPDDHPSKSSAYINWSKPKEIIPQPPKSKWNYQLHEEEIKDTYIRNEAGYTNDNFGTGPFLIIGERPNSGFRRILIQFDGHLISEAVRKKTQEEKIYLQLFKHADSYSQSPIPVKIVPIHSFDSTKQWIEGDAGLDYYLDGVCWGKAGTVPDQYLQPVYNDSKDWNANLWAEDGQWAELDITGIVMDWYQGILPNYGLMIKMANEKFGSELGDHLYASSSYGNSAAHPFIAIR